MEALEQAKIYFKKYLGNKSFIVSLTPQEVCSMPRHTPSQTSWHSLSPALASSLSCSASLLLCAASLLLCSANFHGEDAWLAHLLDTSQRLHAVPVKIWKKWVYDILLLWKDSETFLLTMYLPWMKPIWRIQISPFNRKKHLFGRLHIKWNRSDKLLLESTIEKFPGFWKLTVVLPGWISSALALIPSIERPVWNKTEKHELCAGRWFF